MRSFPPISYTDSHLECVRLHVFSSIHPHPHPFIYDKGMQCTGSSPSSPYTLVGCGDYSHLECVGLLHVSSPAHKVVVDVGDEVR